MREALGTMTNLKALADAMRSLAARPFESPLAISTLRGQFADNAEWRDDPARPAVIVGTVDMIGSRLLFSGYGRGFKSRPLHAGFLGQDTLLIHDEAHLEPAFQEIIAAIESEQKRCHEFGRFRVMALTATSRGDTKSFGLTDAERRTNSDPKASRSLREVWKRNSAKKEIVFHKIDRKDVKTKKELTSAEITKVIRAKITELALNHEDNGAAILIFLRKIEDVEKVTAGLRKKKLPVQVLTGTLRGLDRDDLAKEDAIFARFMPRPGVVPQSGTVYLVCTSAGEVGVDISADHMVCDLTPFDSMAQRFGRVNRFGNGDARIDLVHYDSTGYSEPKKKEKPPSPFDKACEKTLTLLQQLPQRQELRHDASPAALDDLPVSDRLAAFTPPPVILPASDILFDAWALTTIRQRLPGRPPVADWLHGVSEWEPPDTHVAWREEVEIVTDNLLEEYKPQDMLDDYTLKPHELLRDRYDRVFKHLEKLAVRHAMSPVWIVDNDKSLNVMTLGKLVDAGKDTLKGLTVLLPPKVGGLTNGMLDGAATFDEGQRYDVADHLADKDGAPYRLRVWDNDEDPKGMRQVWTVDTRLDSEDEPDEGERATRHRFWRWYVRPRWADDDGSLTARQRQELEAHLRSAEHFSKALVTKLGINDPEASAIKLAASWHDLGKNRAIWQRSIGNHDLDKVLAKSGNKMRPIGLSNYRHELGSLIDVSGDPKFLNLSPDVRDLLLHVIAAHHGRARPHFPAEEAFDPERKDEDANKIALEVPRRFARLERKYGRWGLAYLESLVRAADALASQESER
jgi:CRISPR-associated endonuclease/helicase Cas3